MIDTIDVSMIDWSRAQFALTAICHWLFVPLTLGLAVVIGIMETMYYRTGNEFWKRTVKFWMRIFGINFAVGVATGIIMEFEFGTNWSNYSWFVGDIFGAPLAIEGILAFFMESTFVAVMFFGWDKVSKGFHLASTWLTGLGATISAWWILVANAWMQNPVGMEFNPDTARNEMVDFIAVATSPTAVCKFFHTVLSSWIVAAVFVVGVSCWYFWKKKHQEFALASMKTGAWVGLAGAVIAAWTGDGSAFQVAQQQPMKLAAMEGYYEGEEGAGLVAFGILNPEKKAASDDVDAFLFRIEIPKMLSLLAERDAGAFVPGINDLQKGGYLQKNGTVALSAEEKIERGKTAIKAFSDYRAACKAGDSRMAEAASVTLKENMPYFGYGYIRDTEELVPCVPLTFYMFRVMVILGGYFILFFSLVLFFVYKKNLATVRWMQWVGIGTMPLGIIASQAGWVVAECGRQPWAIQDMLPVSAAISKLDVGSVQTTFFIFVALFVVMLTAELGIMYKSVVKGPEF
ncbi:MAG: cytochrome ubiquinol oxidase subunit I [Bacteroides sp.]|nr:cytochrome ubiquinol oxidase subunit I [Roseburia sp.]MCM1346855.1 cytochrome ubiquinol oxidase subunit I [Bacteroides sp.]MCM1419929.1 cytochrome ubiquinol oxidase subunit I [Bacteroides sp.]